MLVIGVLCLMTQWAKAQTKYDEDIKGIDIKPLHIAISYDKTSNLIFPYPIISVDRGSSSVLAQKAKGAENILQVKAGKINFPQTNLSVITSDARLYSFLVDYAEYPSVLNVRFYRDTQTSSAPVKLSDMQFNEHILNRLVDSVQKAASFLHYTSYEQKIRLTLRSIYIAENVMWFNLQFRNKSLIDYTPVYIRAFVRDKKRAKRTAVQEKELLPIYSNPSTLIEGGGAKNIVIAFPSFTIPKNQELVIQVGEKNGGRSLLLTLSHKAILRARLLND